MIKYHLIEAYRDARRPAAHAPARLAARPRVPRRHAVPVALLPARAARPGRPHRHRRGDRRGGQHAAADDARPAARRVHQAGQGTQARLHGRLGAPEAQRPGAAHGAVQGPVQVARRTGRAAHRVVVVAACPRVASHGVGSVRRVPNCPERSIALASGQLFDPPTHRPTFTLTPSSGSAASRPSPTKQSLAITRQSGQSVRIRDCKREARARDG